MRRDLIEASDFLCKNDRAESLGRVDLLPIIYVTKECLCRVILGLRVALVCLLFIWGPVMPRVMSIRILDFTQDQRIYIDAIEI